MPSSVAEKSNGGPNGLPLTFPSLWLAFFDGVSRMARESIPKIEEAEASQKREWSNVARDAAMEMLKGIAPSQQAQQKQFGELQRQVESCQKLLSGLTQYLNKERQEMQTEMRRLRSDEIDREIRQPILRQLCRAAKEAIRACGQLRSKGADESEACATAINLLEQVAARRQEDLANHGVTLFSAESGDAFNPQLHDAIRRETRPTDDPNLHGRIADVESPGFTLDGTVLEKATVFLFKHNPDTQTALDAKELFNA